MNNDHPLTPPNKDITEPASAKPLRLRWYRLHWSTWIVVALAMAFVAIVEIPANYCDPDNLFCTDTEGVPSPVIEHGWPFVYLYEYNVTDLPDGPQEIDKLIAQNGLPWADSAQSSEIPERFKGEPIWLVAENWKFIEDLYYCKTGLALDIIVVVVFVALVTFLYEWWARRRWRYSLRTLFCLFFLVAAVFAWWRTAVNGWQRELRAVEPLKQKEMVISIDCNAPLLLKMLIGYNHLGPFYYVTDAGPYSVMWNNFTFGPVVNGSVVDNDLEHIADLGHLRYLSLYGMPVTDRCLQYIQGMRRLEELDLTHTRITDKGIKDICNLPCLERLLLRDIPISGDSLGDLKDLPQLRFLHLDNTHITDSSLQQVGKLTKLQGIFLKDTNITDAGLRHLEGMRELQILNIEGTKTTEEDVLRLREKLPNCSIAWEKPIDR